MSDTTPSLSLEEAQSILTQDYVFSANDMISSYSRTRKIPTCPVRYSREFLESCAQNNAEKKAYWVLMYQLELSAFEIRRKKPRRFLWSSFWERDIVPEWLTRSSSPEYLLINLKLSCVGSNRIFWGAKPPELNAPFAVAYTETVIQAMIAMWEFKRETLFLKDNHICGDANGEPDVVLLSACEQTKITIHSIAPSIMKYGVRDGGVVVCRMPGT